MAIPKPKKPAIIEAIQSSEKSSLTNPTNIVSKASNKKISTVNFDRPNGMVNYNGKDLTKQEYDNLNRALMGKKEFTHNPLVDAELEKQRVEGLKQEIKNQLDNSNQVDALTTQILQEQQTQQQLTAQQQSRVEALRLGQLTPEQQNKQAVQGEGVAGGVATAASGVGGLIGGAGAGAAAGAALGSIVPVLGTAAGAVIGGVIGGASGAVGGTYTKIGVSKRQDVKEAMKVFTTAKSNIQWIKNALNSGKIDALHARIMYNEELSNLYAAQSSIKKDTATGLSRFLSGGADEAAQVEGYIRLLPTIQSEIETAILSPDPSKVQTYYEPTEE